MRVEPSAAKGQRRACSLPAIKLDSVSKTFEPAGAVAVRALDRISLDIGSGEFFSIIGPSGCGKSTLLHIIAGFTKPSSGAALYRDAPIASAGPERVMVFQDYGLYPWMTVAENIEFGLKARNRGTRRERAEIVQGFVDMVHLSGFENRYPSEISGGMKQRVGIARALAVDPDVVLMDEPFGALDALTREIMQDEILRIWGRAGGKTFVLITHSIEEAVFLSDHVFVMSARPGRLKELVTIDLPRPRETAIRNSVAFLQYREQLSDLLHSEAEKSMAL